MTDTTTQAPEWVSLLPDDGWSWMSGRSHHEESAIEYVRADLHAAAIAERDALVAQLAAAESRARESALEALSAYGQAAEAHEAQLAAEQRLATCEKYRDAYRECDRIGTDAVRALEAKVAQLESLTRGQDEQLEIQGNVLLELNSYSHKQSARVSELEAQLATARGDALEEAAQYHDKCAADEIAVSAKYRGGSNPWFAHVQSAKWHAKDAAAIRALAKGGTA